MKQYLLCLLTPLLGCSLLASEPDPSRPPSDKRYRDRLLAEYFRSETASLQRQCLSDIHSLSEWQAKREEYRRQLQEMLGLWPMPEKTDLKPVITGRLEREDFVVEKLYFEASPHLYVTANLYLPKSQDKPAPAILYVCGHSRVVTNGVSCGNKVGYQHHGSWFARNGYVCLMIDTLQLGEIEGMHHGTYRENQWWWNSRGYTPAGVEAWFGIRALDYLCSRPEVDKERIGMTGRSGGGSYTWTVAALDERVKVAAPVAGITDLQNQVVDGAVEGHCDCMFFLNTYRWDFPQVSALLAPRPLLLGNSDKDTLFPLDGVVRLYTQTRRIYGLYGATNQLGLLITDGPHADTQDLQVPVFRWFNRFLKHDASQVQMVATPFFSPLELRVFDVLPADQINTKVQESFVPQNAAGSGQTDQLLPTLREKVFGGWPREAIGLPPRKVAQINGSGFRGEVYDLDPQPGINLQLFVVRPRHGGRTKQLVLRVLDASTCTNSPGDALWNGWSSEGGATLRQTLKENNCAVAFFSPRGVEPADGKQDPKTLTQIRRRYMLLGETLDSMRVWDIRCAIQALSSLPEFKAVPLLVQSQGEMGVNAAYAALFEPRVTRLELAQLPRSHMQGPDYLNVLKILDIPELLSRLGDRVSWH